MGRRSGSNSGWLLAICWQPGEKGGFSSNSGQVASDSKSTGWAVEERQDAGLSLVIQGHGTGFQPLDQCAGWFGFTENCAGFCAALGSNPRISLGKRG
jgi:hypothetical protein